MQEETITVTLNIDGVPTECTVVVDHNNEYVCQAPAKEGEESGRFVKFPEGDLEVMVAEYNVLNPVRG